MPVVYKAIYRNEALFTPHGFKTAQRETQKEVGALIKAKLQAATKTWEKPPYFTTRIDNEVVEISTSNRVFNILDKGAAPHTIEPKLAPFLQFKWAGRGNYRPKTQPGSLTSYVGMGGKRAPALRQSFKGVVIHHPGVKPRDYRITLRKVLSKKIEAIYARQLDKWFTQ